MYRDLRDFSDQYIQRVYDEEERIRGRFQNERLKRFFKDAETLFGMVRDYWKGEYREVPYRTIAAIVLTLLYVLNPIDLIPDFIPFFGQMDDATVVALCLYMLRKDIQKYQAWKEEQALVVTIS